MKTAWDKFLDFGKGWGLIITLITAGVSVGVIVKTRIFDSSEQKHDVIKSHKEGPSPEQKQRALILDSINFNKAIKSRDMRDSIFLEVRKDQKIQDSINLLNADQLYQIKQQLQNIDNHQ